MEELKLYPQWCLCDKNLKIPLNIHLEAISVHDIPQLQPYTVVREIADSSDMGYGFILTENDPFSCIDLDIKDELNDEEKQNRSIRFQKIFETFASYSEVSRSGNGVHIWVKGKVPKGRRRDGVEVYSNERFIICTENQTGPWVAIEERQELLNILVSEMGPSDNQQSNLVEKPQKIPDEELCEMATNAANGKKFTDLFSGHWRQYHYPSQSEADLSLMSMLTFYSESNEQCRRLFRYSELGKRDKAMCNDVYLNRLISVIRNRQELEQIYLKDAEETSRRLVQKINEEQQVTQKSEDLIWPPGFIGGLSKHFYRNSYRPVREVSIIAALAIMSGICGKSWNINGTGLNAYYILISRSGIGKDGLYDSINALIEQMERDGAVYMNQFLDHNDYVSSQALIKGILEKPCFLNLWPEIGQVIKDMAGFGSHSTNSRNMRKLLTQLYSRSGKGSIVGGMRYSDKSNNIDGVSGISYSLIGETTPETFYESLTDEMMENGFVSRFLCIEYRGNRPQANKTEKVTLNNELSSYLSQLSLSATDLINRNVVVDITIDPVAKKYLDDFDSECDKQINANTDEGIRQIWNRAHLKVLRIAGLLAVTDNYMIPVITEIHAQWAIYLINMNTKVFLDRYENNEIGMVTDNTRHSAFKTAIKQYLRGEPKWLSARSDYIRDGLFDRIFLNNVLSKKACFKNHRLGATRAINDTLEEMINCGVIMEIPIMDDKTRKGFRGKLYQILDLS